MVTETKTTSYFGRIGNAVKGVFVGVIILVIASVFLFRNEGSIDLSEYAVKAMELFGTEDLVNLDGQFVSLTGEVTVDEVLEDEYVRYKEALILRREVETYAWVEDKETDTKSNTGGSSTTTTNYTYSKKWVTKVPDWTSFKEPEGHENVYNEYDFGSTEADSFGLLGLEVDTFGLRMPSADKNVTAEVELLTDDFVLRGDYLFNGVGTLEDPQVGDARVTYMALDPLANATLFGKWTAGTETVEPYYDGEVKIHGLYRGGKEQALETMHSEYLQRLWLVRAFCLLGLFVGFSLIFAPFHTVLDVVPMFGRIGKGAVSVLSFVLTVIVGGTIIILGKVWYSWLLFAVIALILAGFGFRYYKKSKA